jgi:hypothetical protein
MKRWERWTFGLLVLAVSVTGFAYLWMKYALTTDDPFAVTNHPLQPLMLSAHVLFSPPLILMFGIILNSHILRKIGARGIPNRVSGLLSLGTFAAMTISGYMLQVTTAAALLRGLVMVHVVSGVVFSGAYAVHLIVSVRLARRAQTTARQLARTA